MIHSIFQVIFALFIFLNVNTVYFCRFMCWWTNTEANIDEPLRRLRQSDRDPQSISLLSVSGPMTACWPSPHQTLERLYSRPPRVGRRRMSHVRRTIRSASWIECACSAWSIMPRWEKLYGKSSRGQGEGLNPFHSLCKCEGLIRQIYVNSAASRRLISLNIPHYRNEMTDSYCGHLKARKARPLSWDRQGHAGSRADVRQD